MQSCMNVEKYHKPYWPGRKPDNYSDPIYNFSPGVRRAPGGAGMGMVVWLGLGVLDAPALRRLDPRHALQAHVTPAFIGTGPFMHPECE
jgi:hypothetical protein